MAATMMEFLDTSIVNVAMPSMMGNLGVTLDQIGWVSTGYIITNVIVLPLTGWLSDYFGRRVYLFWSIVLFTIASFGCGISGSLGALIFWRILQGAGGAAFLATAQATLMEIYPPEKRAAAQAIFAMGVTVAPTLGPTLGGLITDNYSWPWIFFINVPVGFIAAFLTWQYMPNSSAAGTRRKADLSASGYSRSGSEVCRRYSSGVNGTIGSRPITSLCSRCSRSPDARRSYGGYCVPKTGRPPLTYA